MRPSVKLYCLGDMQQEFNLNRTVWVCAYSLVTTVACLGTAV